MIDFIPLWQPSPPCNLNRISPNGKSTSSNMITKIFNVGFVKIQKISNHISASIHSCCRFYKNTFIIFFCKNKVSFTGFKLKIMFFANMSSAQNPTLCFVLRYLLSVFPSPTNTNIILWLPLLVFHSPSEEGFSCS